ncbi:MAG: hypothetical protein HXS41_01695 [Theionarchaea archaeon]|nr:hypothetical protein [Theionarchaea archaeon]MBU7002007.1 hypothetical protein [Theionarchaea archaeon]MBU7019742.1 hypothetical protein [Theionarchaea archaeon]MBU7034638.1 hypothetical protein [Theionarchaea archaeon]MBU7040605.1 hypothetical protein [Theionarchaea archaeon]
MKKVIGVVVLILLTTSVVHAGTVPRVVIQRPPQAKVFIYPPICESRELPSIPNDGVIYLQVYTCGAHELYIEFNGQPIRDEAGTIIYYPKTGPVTLEIIPVIIEEQHQHKPCYIMARAVNQYGPNTVYSAFIPIPTGKGELTAAYGCTTMY